MQVWFDLQINVILGLELTKTSLCMIFWWNWIRFSGIIGERSFIIFGQKWPLWQLLRPTLHVKNYGRGQPDLALSLLNAPPPHCAGATTVCMLLPRGARAAWLTVGWFWGEIVLESSFCLTFVLICIKIVRYRH